MRKNMNQSACKRLLLATWTFLALGDRRLLTADVKPNVNTLNKDMESKALSQIAVKLHSRPRMKLAVIKKK